MRIKMKSVISAILASVMLIGTIPAVTYAAQVNEYTDPADNWLKANGRTNELDMNVEDGVRQAARDWEKQAAVTRRFDRAIEYLNVPEVSHTSNQWEKDRYDKFTRSNKVYKMTYDIYERSSWRTDTKKYDVRWSIYTNRPQSQNSYKVAGQERVCNTREEAEKYIQGRIKAYSHLFTELSPPIPKEYEKSFMVYGQLLPGYTTESMQKEQETKQEKRSVRKELASLKEQEKSTAPQKRSKTRSAPELG